jgi:hypothetical protein
VRATVVLVVRMSRIAKAEFRRMAFNMLLLFLMYDVAERHKQSSCMGTVRRNQGGYNPQLNCRADPMNPWSWVEAPTIAENTDLKVGFGG